MTWSSVSKKKATRLSRTSSYIIRLSGFPEDETQLNLLKRRHSRGNNRTHHVSTSSIGWHPPVNEPADPTFSVLENLSPLQHFAPAPSWFAGPYVLISVLAQAIMAASGSRTLLELVVREWLPVNDTAPALPRPGASTSHWHFTKKHRVTQRRWIGNTGREPDNVSWDMVPESQTRRCGRRRLDAVL